MIDLVAGDALLRQRLDAYAQFRLSPDIATSSRLRARVLAVAHRQADLARADSALTIVTESMSRARVAARGHRRGRRALAGLLAASLVLGSAAGSVFAARPGGPLYESRLWLETVTLPSDSSQRALAELDRLEQRLAEAADALAAGDTRGVAAALTAYERIVEQASAAAVAARDDVAVAVLETGVGRSLEVLRSLIDAVPGEAADGLERAIQRAIEHTDRAIQRIERRQEPSRGQPNATSGPNTKPAPAPTTEPASKPTKKPSAGSPGGNGGQPGATSEPGKPDKSTGPPPEHHPN